jgi:hypothetical protein
LTCGCRALPEWTLVHCPTHEAAWEMRLLVALVATQPGKYQGQAKELLLSISRGEARDHGEVVEFSPEEMNA